MFVKGCPLQCQWCHNPESITSDPVLMFTEHLCIGCGECFAVCPRQALDPKSDQRITSRCVGCGTCAAACPSGALEIAGRKASVSEVMREVDQDAMFYRSSGGGVTISGGEPLLQPKFTSAILRHCRAQGYHTALDTSGCASWERFLEVLPYVDLFLYDVKHLSASKHRELTGVDNELILANLFRLSQAGADILVRIPVIPGCNDDADNLRQTGQFLASLPHPPGVEPLPYHALAESKYSRLNRPYPLKGTRPPSEATMDEVKQLLISCGCQLVK